MTAAVDNANVASNTAVGGTTISVSATCGASDNFLLAVYGGYAAPLDIPSSITYNGVGMTHFATDASDASTTTCCYFYMINPPTGSSLVLLATAANSVVSSALVAIPMSGVNTGSPVGTGAAATANDANPAVTPTGGAASDLYIGAVMTQAVTSVTPSGSQTGIVNLNAIHSAASFAVGSLPGSGSGAFTWTMSSTLWVALGVAIQGSVNSASIAWVKA